MEETETELEGRIGKFFLTSGLFCQKTPKLKTHGNRRITSPLSLNGSPDLYIVHKGHYIGIEVKLPKGVQSDAQKSFERLLRDLGEGLYFIARSMEDAENIVRAIRQL